MKISLRSITTFGVALTFCLISTSVWAGSKQQHRWEGVAIGVGAAIIGGSLINHSAYAYHGGPPVAFAFNFQKYHRYSDRHHDYWKRHDGRHHHPGSSHDRGYRYPGHRQHRDAHGSWKSYDSGHKGGQKSHNRGHGGWKR
ncbi:hypothetical protein [Desulfosarcina sp.]|uniref:hypothetical protein n=1 Tax=Desulfosarcina sp. TaxID=2027861 RepID=UPI003970C009